MSLDAKHRRQAKACLNHPARLLLRLIGAAIMVLLAHDFAAAETKEPENLQISAPETTNQIPWTVTINPLPKDEATITELVVPTGPIPIDFKPAEQGALLPWIPHIKLQLQYSRSDWSLVRQDSSRVLKPSSSPKNKNPLNRRIELDIEFIESKCSISLIAIGPLGTVERQNINLSIINWDQIVKYIMADGPGKQMRKRNLRWTATAGVTSSQYKQTGVSDISELALMLKSTIVWSFKARWELGGSMFFSGVPLGSEPTGISLAYLGFNARVGYSLLAERLRWQVVLFGGVYYTTTFSSGLSFGYQNLFGPQIFPAVSFLATEVDAFLAYFKFAAVSPTLGSLSLSDHELATGLAYRRTLQTGGALVGAIDFAWLGLSFSEGRTVSTSSVSVSGGYEF